MTNINPLLVSYVDAGQLLGISHRTIRNQVCKGTFPIKPVSLGGRTLFRVSDIHHFVSTGEPVKPASIARDPNTIDLMSGLTDAEIKPRRGRPRKIVAVKEGGAV